MLLLEFFVFLLDTLDCISLLWIWPQSRGASIPEIATQAGFLATCHVERFELGL